jgi:hypothetical protein
LRGEIRKDGLKRKKNVKQKSKTYNTLRGSNEGRRLCEVYISTHIVDGGGKII